MKPSYYAEYQTYVGGVGKNVMSCPRNQNVFPPAIVFEELRYRLLKVYIVATPHQQEQFEKYCTSQSIETNVEVP